MQKTVEAVIEKNVDESALRSEAVLARDWLRDEEDDAWRHLQQEP